MHPAVSLHTSHWGTRPCPYPPPCRQRDAVSSLRGNKWPVYAAYVTWMHNVSVSGQRLPGRDLEPINKTGYVCAVRQPEICVHSHWGWIPPPMIAWHPIRAQESKPPLGVLWYITSPLSFAYRKRPDQICFLSCTLEGSPLPKTHSRRLRIGTPSPFCLPSVSWFRWLRTLSICKHP